jgi:hypothetical protein
MSSRPASSGPAQSRRRALNVICALAVTACSAPTSTSPVAASLTSLTVAPDSFYVVQGDTFDLQATGRNSDGQTVAPTVVWSATGGSVTSAGRYFAGLDTGTYNVTAEAPGGMRATAVVFLGSNVKQILVTPATVSLSPGQTQQFTARGVTIRNDTIPIQVIWSASGGTITQTGLFTAAASAGPIMVTAVLAPPTINGVPVITPSRHALPLAVADVRLHW